MSWVGNRSTDGTLLESEARGSCFPIHSPTKNLFKKCMCNFFVCLAKDGRKTFCGRSSERGTSVPHSRESRVVPGTLKPD